MKDLLDYLEQETGIRKKELLFRSRNCDSVWAEKFVEEHSQHLSGKSVTIFDDSGFYVIKGLCVCSEGYVCIERGDRTQMRLSATLNGDYLEEFN